MLELHASWSRNIEAINPAGSAQHMDLAIASYEEAHKLAPQDVELTGQWAMLFLYKQDYARAIKELDDATKLDPTWALNWARLGEAKRRQGDELQARGPGWDVYTHGGRKNTGLDAVQWAVRMAEHGAGEVLLTSMDRDGTRIGFDLELTRAVSDAINVPVIASGGVGNLEHLVDGIQKGGADAVLAASIFHYGQHTVAEAKALMAAHGIPVRE